MIEYASIPIGYLLGSISAAVVVARVLRLRDPREVGSQNPGATNILRYGGKGAAIATLLGDLLKGVVAVLIARDLSAQSWVIAATMVAVFVGHLFPLFFGFKGGKGVATALGAYLGANPWVGGALAATWVLVAVVTRYSSLSALVAAALSPVYIWYWLRDPAYVAAGILVAVILFWRHRGNIQRLREGSETRIGN